jgi:hypothetical protein
VLLKLNSPLSGQSGQGLDCLESPESLACSTEAIAILKEFCRRLGLRSLAPTCFILVTVLFQSYGMACNPTDDILSILMRELPQSSNLGQSSLPVTGAHHMENTANSDSRLLTHQPTSEQSQSSKTGHSQNSKPGPFPQSHSSQNEICPDGKSVINDFVAIDTSEWCVISLTQLKDGD